MVVMALRKTPSKPSAPVVDLYAEGARVVSVFGKGARVLIEMSAEAARLMFPEPFSVSARTNVIDAAERDVAAVRKRAKDLGDSALAASAVALAREIEHPYNSATSKSMCAREMRDTLDRLWELAPKEVPSDRLDDIARQRAKRRAG